MSPDVSPAVPAAEPTPAAIRRAHDYRTRSQRRAAGEWTRATNAECSAPGRRRITRPAAEKGPATSMSVPAFNRARRLQHRRMLAAAEKAILAMTPEQRAEFEKELAHLTAQREGLAKSAAALAPAAEIVP